jgi:cell division septum initiation protein DivIVA
VSGYLRDTCPQFIADCQEDPELIKGFLKQNSELIDENRELKRQLKHAHRQFDMLANLAQRLIKLVEGHYR